MGTPDFAQKHPLEYKWTLWFDNPKAQGSKPGTWGQTLRAVYTFDTVEDFWWCGPGLGVGHPFLHVQSRRVRCPRRKGAP